MTYLLLFSRFMKVQTVFSLNPMAGHQSEDILLTFVLPLCLPRSPLPTPGGSPCSICSSFLSLSFCFAGPCETPVCLDLLVHYLASGNRSVAPCNDFFSFVCQTANGTSNSFQALTEENKSQLWRLLGEEICWQSLWASRQLSTK